MKSCIDTANTLQCGGVVGRHRSNASKKIIAAAIGVGYEKEGGVNRVFLS
jgi:hypothetical protein